MVGEAHPTEGLGIIAYDQASIGMQLGREGDQVRKRERERERERGEGERERETEREREREREGGREREHDCAAALVCRLHYCVQCTGSVLVVSMLKGSEVMQIVLSMKSWEEIMAVHYCMLELVFFKVLSHTDTVHVVNYVSEAAFIRGYPGVDEIVMGSPQYSAFMYILHDTKSWF